MDGCTRKKCDKAAHGHGTKHDLSFVMLLNASCRYGTLEQISVASIYLRQVYGASYLVLGANWQRLKTHVLPHNNSLSKWAMFAADRQLTCEEALERSALRGT